MGCSGLSFRSLWLWRQHREPLWPLGASLWLSRRCYCSIAAALRVLPAARRRHRPRGRSVPPHPGPAQRDGGGGARGETGRDRGALEGDGDGAQKTPMTPRGSWGPSTSQGDPNPSCIFWYQHSYGSCGYQSPWGYGHS
ncbi:uncharacterized protein LOC131591110 isoform X2 [Poecile atricapillus]|uniref:uncharacterized protein LOC131591110 isoform X2 n=1 Tax=Poecile atricapillus TaxID=48891 RepID=UPI0027398242|nr:uncharacterized protein LOC131591110 isoform X2 [Poecile atricapillus]